MNRRWQATLGALALVPALSAALPGAATAPARAQEKPAPSLVMPAETVADRVCHPPTDWFSPGGPSWGGSDSLGVPVRGGGTATVAEYPGPEDPFLECAGNAESGTSVAKAGDHYAVVGRNLSRVTLTVAGEPIRPDVVTDELLEFVVPPHADDPDVAIDVHDAAGRLLGSPGILYRSPGPSVTGVVDLSGRGGAAGDEFLVTGARLFEATIRVDDVVVPIIRGSNTATALHFVMPDLPTAPAGMRRLALSSYSGVTSATFAPAAPRPAGPVITDLANDDHANLAHGYDGASMTVHGWGLARARVDVGGRAARVVENFDDQPTFVMPPHRVGEADVRVTTRWGSTFTGSSYLVPSRLPRITSTGRGGTSSPVVHGGDQLVIRGSHLRPSILTVDDQLPGEWGPTDVFTDSMLAFTLPPHVPARDVPIQVHNPGGRAVVFVNYDLPVTAPMLTGLSPATGSTAGGQIQVRGSGFSPLTVSATVGGTVVPAAYVGPTVLKVVLPAHAAGLARVTVTAGNAHRSATTTFNYRFVKPSGSS
jgi:hypothetical protein